MKYQVDVNPDKRSGGYQKMFSTPHELTCWILNTAFGDDDHIEIDIVKDDTQPSNRHQVICNVCNLVYNENGNIENTRMCLTDIEEIESWLLELSKENVLGSRMPTRQELEISLFQVMGAIFAEE